jgi:F-type H+-transporting ATPase subunit b
MHLNATLLGQMITFAIFVWFTMRVIWPILSAQLDERQKKIADGLSAAELGHKILSTAQVNADKKIHEAKLHCYKLLEDADRDATMIVENAKLKAQKEYESILASGHAQLARDVRQAKLELQAQVASIVVLGAEKILERAINTSEHQEILNGLAKKLA